MTVKLDGEDQFAVLPQEDMTEEGLLRYLEVKFARLRPEDYLPLPEEISYGQLPEFLSSALLRYGIGDGTLPEYCALLLQNSGAQRTPEERRASEENWQVTLLYPEGDEYVVGLRSDTGGIVRLGALPQRNLYGGYSRGSLPCWNAPGRGTAGKGEGISAGAVSRRRGI